MNNFEYSEGVPYSEYIFALKSTQQLITMSSNMSGGVGAGAQRGVGRPGSGLWSCTEDEGPRPYTAPTPVNRQNDRQI